MLYITLFYPKKIFACKGVLVMAHCKKFGKAACGHMFKHYERAKDENGCYVKFGNEDIDSSRTCFNYNLATHQKMMQGDFVKKRCSEVFCLNRKDVNVMCSWVVTVPKTLPENMTDIFMRETYNFLEKRYGRENVISAYVHMDEKTPHMHFAFVPVKFDKKKNRYKVSACEVIDRKELLAFHSDLENYLNSRLPCRVDILNEATKEGNKSVEELKRNTAEEELKKIKRQSEYYAGILEKSKKQFADISSQKAKVMSELVDMSARLKNGLKKLDVVSDEVQHLENDKDVLKGQIKAEKDKLLELQQGFETIKGSFEKEFAKTAFREWSTMPHGSSYTSYRDKGLLIALYNDGSQRKVGSNANGGHDEQTLADTKKGLCRVGIMQEERIVNVPQSLLWEMFELMDKEKKISEKLNKFIKQENRVRKAVKHLK